MSAVATPSKKPSAATEHVAVNGVRYALPANLSVAEALRVYMLEIPVSELKEVYIPHTQIEHLHGVSPKLFSEAVGCRLQLGMDQAGDVAWTVNPAGTELYSTSSGCGFSAVSTADLQKRYATLAKQRTISKQLTAKQRCKQTKPLTKKPSSVE